MPSRLDIGKQQILRKLESSPVHIYSFTSLGAILKENREQWQLAQGTTAKVFVAFLLKKTQLREIKLHSRSYPPIVRYCWGEPSLYELGLSMKRGAYLSHGSALFLHGLTDRIPRTIYVNREQSPKPRPSSLAQEAIGRSFSAKQRRSNYVFEYRDWRFVALSGKNTGRLGVLKIKGPKGEPLDVTDLERTLIDIAVRPVYAGGVYEVLEAFRVARTRTSTKRLKRYLRKLDYVYPYHQAIGFYMQRAGYNTTEYVHLQKLGLHYDFYLAHGMAETDYSKEWRLFYPKGL